MPIETYNITIKQADVNYDGVLDKVFLNYIKNADGTSTFNGASWKDMNPDTNPKRKTKHLNLKTSDDGILYFEADAIAFGKLDKLPDNFLISGSFRERLVKSDAEVPNDFSSYGPHIYAVLNHQSDFFKMIDSDPVKFKKNQDTSPSKESKNGPAPKESKNDIERKLLDLDNDKSKDDHYLYTTDKSNGRLLDVILCYGNIRA